jgi:hypothetical protein
MMNHCNGGMTKNVAAGFSLRFEKKIEIDDDQYFFCKLILPDHLMILLQALHC